MPHVKSFRATSSDGTDYKANLLDASAWREIFPEWFEGKTKSLSEVDLYRQQDYFRRAVKVRASAVSDIPWAIHPEGDTDAEPVLTSEMDDVPEEVAYLRGLRQILFETEASLAVLGKAYRLIEQSSGRIDRLKLWPAHQVEPITDRNEGIVKYRRTVNGMPEKHDPEDVLHVRDPDPFHEWNSWGDGGAAKKNANVLRQLSVFLHSYLGRGLIKGTILTIDGQAPQEEKNRLERWFNRFFGGAENAGEAKAINAAVEPKTVGEGISDLSNTELDERGREAVTTAIGVPHSMVLSNAANFATAQADQLNFYLFTALPSAKIIKDAFNDQFLHSQGLHFTWKPERLEVMQRYELDKAEAASKLAGGKTILTVGEARELLGYDAEMPDGLALPTNGEVSQNGQAEPNQDEPEDLSPEAEKELRLWKKKARSGRDASFEAHHVPRRVQRVVRRRLDLGEKVKTAFDPPYHF